MARIPRLDADVFFGSPLDPLPDWRTTLDDSNDEDSEDDLPTKRERDDLVAMLGFSPSELWSDGDNQELADDYVQVSTEKGIGYTTRREAKLQGLTINEKELPQTAPYPSIPSQENLDPTGLGSEIHEIDSIDHIQQERKTIVRTKSGSHAGEPCKPGWSESATGCTPKKKPSGKPKKKPADLPKESSGGRGKGKSTVGGSMDTSSFPQSFADLKYQKSLGGSTGAKLYVDDKTNRKYVVKKGASPAHARNEYATNLAYHALGVPVPKCKMYGDSLVSEYLEGISLESVPDKNKTEIKKKLQAHFLADCLLGNWDVIGMSQDNVLVANGGEVVRVDNGGSMSYRAQGAKKPSGAWGEAVSEIDSMRDDNINPEAEYIFGDMPDSEFIGQLKDISKRKKELLAVLSEEDAKIVEKRLDWLEKMYAVDYPEVGKPLQGGYPPEFLTQRSVDPKKFPQLRNYMGNGYRKINSTMRRCPPKFDCLPPELESEVKDLLSLIESQGKFPEPVVVYRGITLKQNESNELIQSFRQRLLNGEPFSMPSFTSSSLLPETSVEFSNYSGIIFRIVAKSGLYSNAGDEREIIQSPNTKYVVKAVSRNIQVNTFIGKTYRNVVYLEEVD